MLLMQLLKCLVPEKNKIAIITMRGWLSLSVALCVMAATGETQTHPPRRAVSRAAAPGNILLITLDTTRADRMGFLGSKRGLTPNLDALARQATVFTRAYAQAPLTSVSHATILPEPILSFMVWSISPWCSLRTCPMRRDSACARLPDRRISWFSGARSKGRRARLRAGIRYLRCQLPSRGHAQEGPLPIHRAPRR